MALDTAYPSGGAGAGDLLADGTVPMTADWDFGGFDLTNVDQISVGAGDVTPAGELHVDSGSSISDVHITNSSTGATASDGLRIRMNGTNTAQLTNMESGNLYLGTAGTNRVRVSDTGDVMVGNTTDINGRALQVHGGAGTIQIRNTASDATNKTGSLCLAHYTIAEEETALIAASVTTSAATVTFGGGQAALNAATLLEFNTAAANTTLEGTTRMTIDSSGQVGVGASPSDLFHVSATGNADALRVDDTTGAAAFGADPGAGAPTTGSVTVKCPSTTQGLHLIENTTDLDQQKVSMTARPYDTTHRPLAINYVQSDAAANHLRFGGGTSAQDAATDLRFYCAAAVNTALGTLVMKLATDGISLASGANAGATGAATLDIQQAGTTDAIPVLRLEQLDVSEEMIDLDCTIGTGNAIEAVAAKTLTTTHFVKVTITGGLTRYLPVGTIA